MLLTLSSPHFNSSSIEPAPQRSMRNGMEVRTWLVVGLTFVTMIFEIVGGTLLGSVALAADGWEMVTHLVALLIAALACRFARKLSNDKRFVFGPGKIKDLAAFASAIILSFIPFFIVHESVARLITPVPADYAAAAPIAASGLIVNLVCLWLMNCSDQVEPGRQRKVTDANRSTAIAHIIVDALTSVLALIALLGGWLLGKTWIDPVMGLVGAGVIFVWAVQLLHRSGLLLLDVATPESLQQDIRRRMELAGDRVSELRIWHVAQGELALVLVISSDHPLDPDAYKDRLLGIGNIAYLTIEVRKRPQDGYQSVQYLHNHVVEPRAPGEDNTTDIGRAKPKGI